MAPVLRAQDVAKRVGSVSLLSDVTFDLEQGTCVLLNGPADACSTLLRLLATLTRPTSGSVLIAGLDIERHAFDVRRRVAYAGARLGMDGALRVREHLQFVLAARGQRSRQGADSALERAGLDARARVSSLSASMRSRLALATALLPGPDLLLLDEPFQSLDGNSRARFQDWVRERCGAGAAAIIVLHHGVEEYRAFVGRIGHLDAGRLSWAAGGA